LKNIIRSIRSKSHEDNRHISKITGVREAPKPTYYKNTETDDEYYDIIGALAFSCHRTPGFAVIAAAIKDEQNHTDPKIEVLDEIESADGIDALLKACKKRRERWGYPKTLKIFYGDQERFITAISDFNQKVSQPRTEKGIYLAPPADFHLPNRSEIYLERIKSLLRKDEKGEKRLSLGTCKKLRTHLQDIPADADKYQIEVYPAVAALGYAVHSILSLRPWMRFVKHEQGIRTIQNGYENYAAYHQREAFDQLYSLDDEYDDESDDRLIPTI
jgi:hypothetical protein